MSVRLPYSVRLAQVAVFVTLVSNDQAGQDPLAAKHESQRRGKVFAVALRLIDDEVLNRIQGRVARRSVQAVAEPIRLAQVGRQNAGAADRIVRRLAGFGHPSFRKLCKSRQRFARPLR